MLHLGHISQYDFSCAVIASVDADVTFLSLTNYHKFPMPLFQMCCSEIRMKYVDIPSIGNVLERYVCEELPGMHAITGCDTVSSFAGKGKLSAFKLVKKNVSFQELIARLGLSWEFSDADFTKLQMFTCSLYGAKSLSLMSTLTGSNCSAPNMQALKDTSFLLVLTASSTSTVSVPVTKQLFGKEQKFQVQLEKGASRTKVMLLTLQLTRCKACQL